jgi:hypothetical protein
MAAVAPLSVSAPNLRKERAEFLDERPIAGSRAVSS